MEKIREYESEIDFSGNEDLHKKLKEMSVLLEKAVMHVKEKDNPQFQEYHARRLVEMTIKVILGYLLLRDASLSERKKEVAKLFFEFAHPEVKMKCDIITVDTSSLLKSNSNILDGKN